MIPMAGTGKLFDSAVVVGGCVGPCDTAGGAAAPIVAATEELLFRLRD